MAETHITRCPHCHTTFRIRTEQLSAAKGAVRCGSCLQVFKATEHIVTQAATDPEVNSPSQQESDTPENSPSESSLASESEAKPESQHVEDEIAFDDIPDQIADNPLEDFGIRQPDSDSNETFDSGLQLDDSIFGMQDEHSSARYSHNNKANEFEFSTTDTFSNYDADSAHDESWASTLIEDESSSPKFSADDESWADDLLNFDDDLVDNLDEEIDQAFAKASTPKEKDDFVPSLDGPQEDTSFHLGGDGDIAQEEIELTINDSINDLQDEPLALTKNGQKPINAVNAINFPWLWFSASVLMLFVTIAQIGYFKFESWSREPDYRPVYALICETIGCQLPTVQDTSKMSTQHFMVRPHPEVNDALYIDTLLINKASYEQPFPNLVLVFTGLEDQVVASRSFKPKEYLAGELAGATLMPPQVPIHIAFEIRNPGVEAVSYRIQLSANH